MPTNLGDLPLNQPVRTGICQIKRGYSGGGAINMNNTVSARALENGLGNPMWLTITPTQPGWWVIRAETIWNVPDAVWTYWHWGVILSPADNFGANDDRNHCAQHSALGWCESVINTAFRLSAGVTYTTQMWWYNASAGYNQQYWSGADYHYIMAEFVGEGSL